MPPKPPPPVAERDGVTPEMFEQDIVPAYRPVVMRGLAAAWPAVAACAEPAAAAAYLSGQASARPVEVFVGAPDMGGRFFHGDGLRGFNFERRRVALAGLLAKLVDLSSDPAPFHLYAGGVSVAEHLPGFAASHPMPLVPAGASPRLWVGNATRVAPHYDLARNIAVCVAGRRHFTLFPPEQTRNLYVGPIEATIAGQPASLVDLDAPDLDRFPRFASALAAAQAVDLLPGDALYIPPLWWHGVRSPGPLGVLVNYWWGQAADASPFEALIHALLAVRDLPPGERAAWRAAFDHYAFDPEIPDHIPEAARGVLGPASPARSETMRAFLAGALTRRR